MRLVTVTELNNYIKDKMDLDPFLGNLWIKGEISNFKHHYSGHMYFTLKDSGAILRCVMFRSRASLLKFTPENGLGIIARGRIGVYERDGQYQLYVDEMQPDGIGALYIAFQQLKEKLDKEGLFEKTHKKPIPRLPKRIAVITSPTGAAVRDIITVLHRRCPQVEIILSPVAVQGDSAPPEIAEAIATVNEISDIDLIIVGRGGGSLEELWAFNTEVVARSIFQSVIPIISAVGHETDVTIADFVSDLRAPTPSAAAELAVPDYREIVQQFGALEERLLLGLNSYLGRLRNRVELCARSRSLTHPGEGLGNMAQKVDFLVNRLESSYRAVFLMKENSFRFATAELNNLSPLATLDRGYSLCRDKETNGIIKSVDDLIDRRQIEVILKDGSVDCTVDNIRR